MQKSKQRNKKQSKQLKPLGDNCIDFILRDGIFKKNFHVFVGKKDRVIPYFNKLNLYKPLKGEELFVEGYAGMYVCLMEKDGEAFGPSKASLIWLESINYSDIVHECFHAIFDSLKIDDIKLSEETNEVFAYYLSWLFEEIKNNIKQRGYRECNNTGN